MADRRVLNLRMRRRLRPGAAVGVLAVAALLALSGWVPGHSPATGTPAAAATCRPFSPQCQPNRTPTPCDSPFSCCAIVLYCSTPTPDVVVISPVPADPPSPRSTTPSYLVGLPSSSSPGSSDTGGAIAPLGTGSDTPPSPGSGGGGGGGGTANEALKSSGLPLPFMFAMLLVASICASFLFYRFAPRGRRLPTVQPAPPKVFTPYGSDSATTANLLDPSINRPD